MADEQKGTARKPQAVRACDRCSFGVMDENNPHMWNECRCICHQKAKGGAR